jgi:hypothetical protein
MRLSAQAKLKTPEHEQMKWPWPGTRMGDVTAIVLTVALIAGVFIFTTLVKIPNLAPTWNNGFGPEWDCTSVGKGDPVCIRKPLAASEKPAKAAP